MAFSQNALALALLLGAAAGTLAYLAPTIWHPAANADAPAVERTRLDEAIHRATRGRARLRLLALVTVAAPLLALWSLTMAWYTSSMPDLQERLTSNQIVTLHGYTGKTITGWQLVHPEAGNSGALTTTAVAPPATSVVPSTGPLPAPVALMIFASLIVVGGCLLCSSALTLAGALGALMARGQMAGVYQATEVANPNRSPLLAHIAERTQGQSVFAFALLSLVVLAVGACWQARLVRSAVKAEAAERGEPASPGLIARLGAGLVRATAPAPAAEAAGANAAPAGSSRFS